MASEQIPTDMSLDTDYDDRNENVHIITPEDSVVDETEQAQQQDTSSLRADDFDAIAKEYMPRLPDLETLGETHYTWDIENWRHLSKRENSPPFECAGFPWKILFFPHGNNVESASLYLEQGYGDTKPPENWYACAQFLLVLWNPNDPAPHDR